MRRQVANLPCEGRLATCPTGFVRHPKAPAREPQPSLALRDGPPDVRPGSMERSSPGHDHANPAPFGPIGRRHAVVGPCLEPLLVHADRPDGFRVHAHLLRPTGAVRSSGLQLRPLLIHRPPQLDGPGGAAVRAQGIAGRQAADSMDRRAAGLPRQRLVPLVDLLPRPRPLLGRGHPRRHSGGDAAVHRRAVERASPRCWRGSGRCSTCSACRRACSAWTR